MRTPRRRPTRADLEVDGPPIRLSDLAALAGFSRQKLRAELAAGDLHGSKVRCATRFMVVIDRSEARRYLGAIYAKAC